MRQSTSDHYEFLRLFNVDASGDHPEPSVYVEHLINLLDHLENRHDTNSSGKKRASPFPDLGSSKRSKTSALHVPTMFGRENHVEDDAIPDIDEERFVPALHHTSEIQCKVDMPPDAPHHPAGERLSLLLTKPETYDLGVVDLQERKGMLVALSPLLDDDDNDLDAQNQLLLIVPKSNHVLDVQAMDLKEAVDDILMAAHILMRAERATIVAHLQLIVPPGAHSYDDSLSTFHLRLDISISLVLANLVQPVPGQASRKKTLIEDAQLRFLYFLFPGTVPVPASFEGETNISFFYSILGPAPQLASNLAEDAMQPRSLVPQLLPFQRRSVGWLLGREGKSITTSGDLINKLQYPVSDCPLPPFWQRIELGNKSLYMNYLDGRVLATPPLIYDAFGGILAEEPGLGKTLMCISMIFLNPDPGRNPSRKCWDPVARLDVKEIKTTLIVTPVSLASQWAEELARHAPTLRVLVYDGWSKVGVPITEAAAEKERKRKRQRTSRKALNISVGANSRTKRHPKKRQNDGRANSNASDTNSDGSDDGWELSSDQDASNEEVLDWCAYVNTFDVCIITYNTLRAEVNVARAAPVRPRREDVSYSTAERPQSPLVMCEWYRVIMDEVQMAGGGKIEEMVSLLPRFSSFAVSGTPAKSQIANIWHVLKFLRVHNTIGSERRWNRLLKPAFAGHFSSFFERYAIRTMKSSVKNELTIPQQTCYLVSIALGPVERHVYNLALELGLRNLGLDVRGVTRTDDWKIDTLLLRTVLRRLRGMCTHPQVGQVGARLHKPGTLKTVNELLGDMKDENWRTIMDHRKLRIQSLVRSAQLQERDETDPDRHERALELLSLTEKETTQLLGDIQTAITIHDEKGDLLNGSASESRAQQPENEEHAASRRGLQARIRECKVLLHRIKFMQGDVHHRLGETHSEAENAAYQAAEVVRQSLLRNNAEGAMSAMAQLNRDIAAQGLTREELLIRVPYLEHGGIRTRESTDEAHEIITDLLNEQSELLWKWRTHIHGLLTHPLLVNGEDADGQEYARSLEVQGEAGTYFRAYAALLSDRKAAISSERTLLAAHDIKEKKLRQTKAAAQAMASAEAEIKDEDEIEQDPRHDALYHDLSEQRNALIAPFQGRALKSVLFDLNRAATWIVNDKDPEKIIIRRCVQSLRQLIAAQAAVMHKLEADLQQFRKAFNERILYFAQLQELSDSVEEVTWQGCLPDAREACIGVQKDLEAQINTNKARQRYLEHLSRDKEGERDEDEEICVLCRTEPTRGYITPCAHMFCSRCLNAWMKRPEGRACPICRVIINTKSIRTFVFRKESPQAVQPKPVVAGGLPQQRRPILYNRIDQELFKDIQTIHVDGSYGSKVQALTRHLLFLQMTEPKAKSIVFSAWADSLHIIEHALTNNGIPCLRIDQNSKTSNAANRFRTDDQILVLLLHGERENAGLNLTCASRVFLVESVVHHGFELQAIARIDRMSQLRETEVFCYYAEDTVERNILDLAARKGQSLYTKDKALEISSLASGTPNQPASPSKKGQKGDDIYSIQEMLQILLPHTFFPSDYMSDEEAEQDEWTIIEEGPSWIDSNAEAGPSRLN